MLCIACGGELRAQARFCGVCGHARDGVQHHSLAPLAALRIALACYGVVTLSNVIDLGAVLHGWEGFGWTESVIVVVAACATVALARRNAVGWLRAPRRLSLIGAAQALLGLALAYGAATILGLLLRFGDGQMLDVYRADEEGLAAALLAIAGLTPLLEEWLFRGVLLECMVAVFPLQTAVIVSALLFAMLHLTPATIVHHGLVGYVCGRVRLDTGSVWPAVACHALYNALVVLHAW